MSKQVLVADDSEIVRENLKLFFEGAGFSVTEAVDGREAAELLKSKLPFCLIISDLNMPFMSGLELSKFARNLESYQKTPIFLLSTESTPELKSQGKASGVTAWILKPFEPESMREILVALELL